MLTMKKATRGWIQNQRPRKENQMVVIGGVEFRVCTVLSCLATFMIQNTSNRMWTGILSESKCALKPEKTDFCFFFVFFFMATCFTLTLD